MYFLVWYAVDHANELSDEYILGATHIAFYSVPLWLYALCNAFFRRKKLNKNEILLSIFPALFMVSTLSTVVYFVFNMK